MAQYIYYSSPVARILAPPIRVLSGVATFPKSELSCYEAHYAIVEPRNLSGVSVRSLCRSVLCRVDYVDTHEMGGV